MHLGKNISTEPKLHILGEVGIKAANQIRNRIGGEIWALVRGDGLNLKRRISEQIYEYR